MSAADFVLINISVILVLVKDNEDGYITIMMIPVIYGIGDLTYYRYCERISGVGSQIVGDHICGHTFGVILTKCIQTILSLTLILRIILQK